MELTLTWDLLIVVFFGIVTAYSFIVGKTESVKIIIASYVAIVAVQGVSALVAQGLALSGGSLDSVGLPTDPGTAALGKLTLFVAIIVFLSLRAGFDVQYKKNAGSAGNLVLTALLGIATAGLLLSTLLTFIAGKPLLDASLALSPDLAPLLAGSALVDVLVTYQSAWFSLPALLLIGSGFVGNK